MNIVYLVFGDNYKSYQQAYFSILTMLSEASSEDKVIIITDHKDYFTIFGEKVEVIEIDNDILKEWKGPYNFFWRVKIKALLTVNEKYPNSSIFYLDSDTFLINDFKDIKKQLDQGNNLMHLNEGHLNKIPYKTERVMWKQMKNKDHAGITISSSHCMWNAGVVAISKHDTKCLSLALALCDSMCKSNVRPRLIEQFSFSVALGEYTKLVAAEKSIGHYWGNKKEWNELISKFIIESSLKSITLEEQINTVKEHINLKVPIVKMQSSTRGKLGKLLDKMFSERITYI